MRFTVNLKFTSLLYFLSGTLYFCFFDTFHRAVYRITGNVCVAKFLSFIFSRDLIFYTKCTWAFFYLRENKVTANISGYTVLFLS